MQTTAESDVYENLFIIICHIHIKNIYSISHFSTRVVHKAVYIVKSINGSLSNSLNRESEETPATATGKDAMLWQKHKF